MNNPPRQKKSLADLVAEFPSLKNKLTVASALPRPTAPTGRRFLPPIRRSLIRRV
jgi:hypothetical protein